LASPAPAGAGGPKSVSPEPGQPQALPLGTAALDITPSAPPAQSGSVGVGTDNVPPTPPNPQLIFHGDAEDFGSHASPAQLQAASRAAKTIVSPALPQLPSTSQARPPSLVPSDLISTRTRRSRAAAAGSPKPAVDYGFDTAVPAPPPAEKPAAVARRPSRPRVSSPPSEGPARPTNPAPTITVRSAAAATEPSPPLLGVQSSEAASPAALPEVPSPAELEISRVRRALLTRRLGARTARRTSL
ncbi:unnamed protein product, partial [Laminaria digitata]